MWSSLQLSIPLLLLLAATLTSSVAEGAPSSRADQPSTSGAPTKTEAPCIITTYTHRNASLMEYRYTMTTLMAAISHHCRCHLQLLDRQFAPDGIRQLSTYRQPAMILIAARGVTEEEQQAILEAGQHALKLVVVHQSDEHGTHDVSWYPYVKAVFRNYHRDLTQLAEQTRYLQVALRRRLKITGSRPAAATPAAQSQPQQPASALIPGSSTTSSTSSTPNRNNVYWFPLGFGDFFVPSQAMQLEFGARPLLWSWTGSTFGKRERLEMIRQLNGSEVMPYGLLYAFEHFKSAVQLPPVRYTSLLYESKLVPLPPGVHAEQFRLWEALVAGAIPMALKKHADAGLAHVTALQLRVLWLESWADAPALMMEVLKNPAMQRELTTWQEHNSRQYVRIMRSVQQQMAVSVCNRLG